MSERRRPASEQLLQSVVVGVMSMLVSKVTTRYRHRAACHQSPAPSPSVRIAIRTPYDRTPYLSVLSIGQRYQNYVGDKELAGRADQGSVGHGSWDGTRDPLTHD